MWIILTTYDFVANQIGLSSINSDAFPTGIQNFHLKSRSPLPWSKCSILNMVYVSEHIFHKMGLSARCSLAVHSLDASSLAALPGFQLFFAETWRPIAPAHHVITVLIGQEWRVCNLVFWTWPYCLQIQHVRAAPGIHPSAAAHHRGFVSYTYSQCVRCLAGS